MFFYKICTNIFVYIGDFCNFVYEKLELPRQEDKVGHFSYESYFCY